MGKISIQTRRRLTLSATAVFILTVLAAMIILFAAGENRFTLACVLPFLFIAGVVPFLAARIIDPVSTDQKTVPKNRLMKYVHSGLLDFVAFILGLVIGLLVAAPSASLLVSIALMISFALSVLGLTVLLALVLKPAFGALIGSAAGWVVLLSPVCFGPLLRHSGPTLKQVLLWAAYWLNPMAIATHAGLGRDFFRFRGGPVSFYDLGIADYVYPYPAWWAVALLHAIAGLAVFTLALWFSGRRNAGRQEAGDAA
ncbi:MAG: hypothetical protein E3J72_11120 [Planctomycetota bacterium]|nr:MAG: hypothetical protein E3J72_11120 [Planctomycetota bacterium]